MTLEQVGQEYGLTGGRIHQIEVNVLRKLRRAAVCKLALNARQE